MVTTLLKSTLREIRQSLGRYLAILAIVGLGVGFFAGLRMAQPDMMATGVAYLEEYRLFDFQLMSTLGFTEEDVAALSQLEGIAGAEGSVYTDFLMERGENDEVVVTARSLTADMRGRRRLFYRGGSGHGGAGVSPQRRGHPGAAGL